ncbi:copper resistance CopC family protein [Micromonospora aurantiaca (nom. illeg.)]|uniref:copper resistance CopC family protein n=1 Tax=Micromonospora aurantiaca (nom. illeg.) TaxID=47850 RepID=UPI003F4A7944
MNRPHALTVTARVAATLCVGAAALLAPASPAYAHNALRASTPAQDDRLPSPPTQVELVFAERLDPQFTTIAVTRQDTPVTTGKPTVAGTRATQPLTGGLAAGGYTVAYRVVSVDGHPVQGSYTFTVTAPAETAATPPASSAPPATATPSSGSPTPAAAAGGKQDSGLNVGAVGLAVAALAVLAAGLALLARRRLAARR